MESEAVLLDRFLVVAFSIKGCVGRHEEGKGFLSISVGSWNSNVKGRSRRVTELQLATRDHHHALWNHP